MRGKKSRRSWLRMKPAPCREIRIMAGRVSRLGRKRERYAAASLVISAVLCVLCVLCGDAAVFALARVEPQISGRVVRWSAAQGHSSDGHKKELAWLRWGSRPNWPNVAHRVIGVQLP